VISISRSELARQMDALVEMRSVEILDLESLIRKSPEQDCVAITFDDGFANFAVDAMPVLEERGIHATVFVVSSRVGAMNEWERTDSRALVPALPLMTWDAVGDVKGRGATIGAHGASHRSLKGLSREALEAELAECVAAIESNTGARPTTLAYPYGDFDEGAINAASDKFAAACTTEFSLVTDSSRPHALPRLDSYYFRDNDMLSRFGSREFAAWVAVRGAARTVRQRWQSMRLNG
jgi:peptidoglycan/xylan/chitin deacetylase (PgdA/CDA1 family)